jgi:Spy/CpxP family protein refolding chaperone
MRVVLAIMLVALASPASAQAGARAMQRRLEAQEGAVTPAEIQRMFDSYALMQAQEQLQISDDQFPQFLARFKALQEVRRRALLDRARHLAELRRLINLPQADDAALRDQLAALEEIDARAQAESKRALEAIDQLLTLRQQAKFRIFEELMERRKLELVNRARQANRNRPK